MVNSLRTLLIAVIFAFGLVGPVSARISPVAAPAPGCAVHVCHHPEMAHDRSMMSGCIGAVCIGAVAITRTAMIVAPAGDTTATRYQMLAPTSYRGVRPMPVAPPPRPR